MFCTGITEEEADAAGIKTSSPAGGVSGKSESVGILLTDPVDEVDTQIEHLLLMSELELKEISTLINEDTDEPIPEPEAVSKLTAYAAQKAVFNKMRMA